MFMGTLPHKAIKIIRNVVKEWDCERIYVGCAGNFTMRDYMKDDMSKGLLVLAKKYLENDKLKKRAEKEARKTKPKRTKTERGV